MTNTEVGIRQLLKEDGSLTKRDRDAAEILNQQYFRISTKEDTTNIPQITPKHLLTEVLASFEVNEKLVK